MLEKTKLVILLRAFTQLGLNYIMYIKIALQIDYASAVQNRWRDISLAHRSTTPLFVDSSFPICSVILSTLSW